MSASLLIHRAYIVVVAPFAWLATAVVLLVLAPFEAAEMVWTSGIKKHWGRK